MKYTGSDLELVLVPGGRDWIQVFTGTKEVANIVKLLSQDKLDLLQSLLFLNQNDYTFSHYLKVKTNKE